MKLWEATEGFLAWGWQAGRPAFLRENASSHVEGGLEGEKPGWVAAALGQGERPHVGSTGGGGQV